MAKHGMLTHRATEGELSACGLRIPAEYLTSNMGDVTCRSCNRENTRNNRSDANRKARSMPGFADPDFKGAGVLDCYQCGRKIREHPRWPCSFPPVQGLVVEPHRRRG